MHPTSGVRKVRTQMTKFEASYVGQLRQIVGRRLILIPSARLLVEASNGQILLQHRRDFGTWGLPGGNAEEREGLQALIAREAAEEVGLDVSDVHPYGFADNPAYETIHFPNGDTSQYFAMLFYTRSYTGTAHVADDESLDVQWFSPGNLPPMAINHARSVEAYYRFQATGEFQFV
jgi:8-oxo-dGTP pyrophosphatase MutT (NUDIX family)